jgi:hypothetical protein
LLVAFGVEVLGGFDLGDKIGRLGLHELVQRGFAGQGTLDFDIVESALFDREQSDRHFRPTAARTAAASSVR